MTAPTAVSPVQATTKPESCAPRTSTNSAEVAVQLPELPRRRQPASSTLAATTTARAPKPFPSTAETPRARAAPRAIAATDWIDPRTEPDSVVDVAITAPSGA
jgi:hypothetical protein